MSIPKGLRSALLPLLFTVAAGESVAQNVTIDFTNAEMEPIKLLNGTSVGIDGEGNLTAQCVLAEGGTTCDGVSAGNDGDVPLVTLTRVGTADIFANGTLNLSWTVQPAADVCLATSDPAVPGWNNTVVAATGGNANLTMSTAGTFQMSLKCYNEDGVSNTSSVSVIIKPSDDGGEGTQIPACTVPGLTETGRVQPQGFTGFRRTWSQLFYGAQFPNMPSHLVPVGSWSLRTLLDGANKGPNMNGKYITVPFVPAPNTDYKLAWLGIQGVDAAQYYSPRNATSLFVSVSPCAGDLRGRVNGGAAELSACRSQSRATSLFFGTKPGTSCELNAGQTYWLNIAFIDASGTEPLSTSTTTCQTGNRCEGNFKN